jgi:2'-5' RNA ligase
LTGRLHLVTENQGDDDSANISRLFIACEIPLPLQEKIDGFYQSLGLPPLDMRNIHPPNFHITLKYLGNTPREKTDLIKKSCRSVSRRFGPLRLCIEGVGLFPNHDRPRVLWCGVSGADVTSLEKMEGKLSEQMEKHGFAKETSHYEPHITLARVKNSRVRGRLARIVRSNIHLNIGNFKVSSFLLFKSEISRNGAVHSPLARFPLTGDVK